MASFRYIAFLSLGIILAASVAIVPACNASSETEITNIASAAPIEYSPHALPAENTQHQKKRLR
ncbi:MAG: hypothetical protein ACYSR4_10260 [Planctomycetota bacterium]